MCYHNKTCSFSSCVASSNLFRLRQLHPQSRTVPGDTMISSIRREEARAETAHLSHCGRDGRSSAARSSLTDAPDWGDTKAATWPAPTAAITCGGQRRAASGAGEHAAVWCVRNFLCSDARIAGEMWLIVF